MIDITGMTQIDIEAMASRSELKEIFQIQCAEFYNQIDDEDIVEVSQIVGNQNVDDVLLELIYIIGMKPEKPRYLKNESDFRLIEVEKVITALAGTKTMQMLYGENKVILYKKSASVVISMEDILYDIELQNKPIEDGQFVTSVYCIVGFDITEQKELTPEWDYFRLPLVEQPKDWMTYQNGGYHSVESKCTLNLGEGEQTQDNLDILNKLQHQRFQLHKNSSPDEYYDYKIAKAMKEDDVKDESLVHDKVKNTLVSYESTLDTMFPYEFMFEWKFDFRGRIYNTAYNIALQGDKYQKGMVLPCPNNFKGY